MKELKAITARQKSDSQLTSSPQLRSQGQPDAQRLPITKTQFKDYLSKMKVRADPLKIEGIEHLGIIHDICQTRDPQIFKFCGDRYTARIQLNSEGSTLLDLKEVEQRSILTYEAILKYLYYGEYEMIFCSGKNPEFIKGNETVGKLNITFWQTTSELFTNTGYYLYFKDTATSLVRVSQVDMMNKLKAGEKMVPVQELAKNVECYYAQGPSYWILNKEGEIRSYGPLTAIMRLGPTIQITSTSAMVPLGLNLLVCWHSLKANKNHFVLFSKQMEYFSSLSTDVKEGKLWDLT